MTIDARIDEMILTFLRESAGSAAVTDYTDGSSLVSDLNLDSLDLVAFLAQMEDYWGFAIPDEDFSLENFATVGAVRAYIKAMA